MLGNAHSLETPLVAGKYRPLLELGQGGTAHVHLAVAEGPSGFNKLVVLKSLKSALADDPQFRDMFLNEARLCARLNHPHAVQVLEVIESEGLPVIVMEYLDGRSLATTRIRAQARLTPAMELRILSDALSALHYCHELCDYNGQPLHVVHRDMTPQNLFLTFDGHVKLLDFGIAKLSGSLIETQSGLVKGKLRYMPPEQITGESLDRRTDVYAVGVMLWEAITGQRLWGKLPDAAIMNRTLQGQIPTPSSVRADVPPALEAICLRALAAEPDDRFPTAEALQLALDEQIAASGDKASHRDLSLLMTHCFQAERTRTQQIIEDELGHISLSQPLVFRADETNPESAARLRTDRTSTEDRLSPTDLSAHEAPTESNRAPGKRGSLGALGLLLFVTLGIGALVGLRHRPQAKPGATPAAVEAKRAEKGAEPLNQAAPDPAFVRIRVTVFPAHAALRLDGTPLPSNPYLATVPRDGKLHELVATADGFTSQSVSVEGNQDSDIVVNLEPQTSGNTSAEEAAPAAARSAAPGEGLNSPEPQPNPRLSASTRPAKQPAPKPPAPATPTTPHTDHDAECATPYYVDQRGIKKFNRGCF